MSLFLGIDVGTSGAKAVLCDSTGRIIASATSEYPLLQPHEGWSEQHPEEWWRASCDAIRRVVAGSDRAAIASIGLSGQMHGSVLLGQDALRTEHAVPLRPAILWNDQRTSSQCVQIEHAVGGRTALVKLVGNAALPGFTLPKLLWVREHEPEIWKQVRAVLLPKDYVRYRLTGLLCTDVGDASGTLLFDVDARGWSQAVLRTLDIDPAIMPRAIESGASAGHVSASAAEQTGLVPGTIIAAGSGDNMCAGIGAGVVEPGIALAVLGTSGVIYAHSPRPRKDLPPASNPSQPAGRVHTMCDAAGPAAWCVTGCTLAAGGALRWARDTIAPGVSYDQIMHEAATVPVGSGGLLFMPQLNGERCPYPDPLARGGWIGLTARHTRAHLFRAVIEGVSFTMVAILDLMRSMGIETQSVRLSGGGNRAAFWRQMQADLYQVPVVTTNSDEGGSALGAALLGAVAAGEFASVPEACRATISPMETRDPAAPSTYERPRRIHAKLYHDLRERMAELADR